MRRLFLVVLLIPVLAGATMSNRIEESGWHGGMYQDENTGAFQYCMIAKIYNAYDQLSVGINGARLFLVVLKRADWKFDGNTQLRLGLKTDEEALNLIRVDIIGTSEVRIILQYSRELMDRLAKTSVLNFTSGQEVYAYDISGDSKAFGKLDVCYSVQELLMGVEQQNPGIFEEK